MTPDGYILSPEDRDELAALLAWWRRQGPGGGPGAAAGRRGPAWWPPHVYGKLAADWSASTPAYVTVNRCRHDGTVENTAATRVYLSWPGEPAATYANLETGDIIAYITVWDPNAAAWVGIAIGQPSPGPAGLFACLVWQDGGTTDGDLTQQCDRTYTVRTLDATAVDTGGVQLGTTKTPKKLRPAKGQLTCPLAMGVGVVGLGYFDLAGTFQLWDANEIEGVCT